jgi:hypothetical protein
VHLISGTFLSNVGLAASDWARWNKVLFVAAESLTEALTWAKGHDHAPPRRPRVHPREGPDHVRGHDGRAGRGRVDPSRLPRRVTASAAGPHLDATDRAHHDAAIRTTLTLDADVARLIEDEMHRWRKPFKQVVNEGAARRAARRAPDRSTRARSTRTTPTSGASRGSAR